MKKVILFLLLVSAQFSFAQYSGEAKIVFENSQTDIVRNADKSADLKFSIVGIDEAQYAKLQQELESKAEISNVQLDNGVWTMHVEAGTQRKVVLTYFMNYGFKYISVDGETDDILGYQSKK